MAEEVTSGLIYTQIDGSDTFFRTKVTFDGTRVRKNEIHQSVSEDDYNNLSSEQKGGEIEGFYFKIVKIDDDYTSLATESVQKSLSSYDLRKETDGASLDALLTSKLNDPTLVLSDDEDVREDQIRGIRDSFGYNFSTQLNVADDAGDANNGGGKLLNDGRFELKLQEELGIKGVRQKKYNNLFYPETIATSKQDRILFTMFYQTGRNISFDISNPKGNIFTFGDRRTTNIEGSVTLPIQGGISDRNEVDYQGRGINPVIGALASVALDPGTAVSQILDVLNKDAGEIQDALNTTASKNIINVLKTYLAQSAVGTQGLIPRTTGAILNPNLELLLSAPNLRSFRFSFKMSARSRTEATQIKKIIRFFKQGMSVKRSPTSLFIVSPNMFRIKYLTDGGIQHPSIGRIKDCALTSLNTQYTPDGTYMTFDDEGRTMTSYQIDMTFTELEPLTEDDYITGPVEDDPIFPNDNQIGY